MSKYLQGGGPGSIKFELFCFRRPPFLGLQWQRARLCLQLGLDFLRNMTSSLQTEAVLRSLLHMLSTSAGNARLLLLPGMVG